MSGWGAGSTANDEARVRRAARAFPPRWRAHSEEELVWTAVASPVTRRVLADIALAGWRERHRDHPPLGYWLMLRIVRCDRARPVRPSLHSEERQSQLFVTLVGVPMLIIAMVALAIESAAVSLSVEVLALTVGIIATLTSVAARRSPRADPFTVRDLWERPRVSVGAGGPPSGSG